jgi:hypothetical protein
MFDKNREAEHGVSFDREVPKEKPSDRESGK